MALVIRMRQQGASNCQHFRIVVTEVRAPRDGRYVEKLGWYNPFGATGSNCVLNIDRFQHWINHGAQASDRVLSLVNTLSPDVIKQMTAKKQAKREKARVQRKKK